MIIFYWVLTGIVCDLILMAFIASQESKKMARICKGLEEPERSIQINRLKKSFAEVVKDMPVWVHILIIAIPPSILLAFDIFYEVES